MGRLLNNKKALALFLFFISMVFVLLKRITIISSDTTFIPVFKTIDTKGNTLDHSILGNRISYFQFIEANSDMDLLNKVFNTWKDKINIVCFVNDPRKLNKLEFIKNASYTHIITKDYNTNKHLFASKSSIGEYYIYSNYRKFIAKGRNDAGYDDGPKIYLNLLYHNISFDISSFITNGVNINSIPWFYDLVNYIKPAASQYKLIAFFSSICDSCESGQLLDLLNSSISTFPSLYVLIVLNDPYSPVDIDRLKSQLKTQLRITIADLSLRSKWNSLINEYRKEDINNIIVIIDNNDIIHILYHPKCNCMPQFISFINLIRSPIITNISCLFLPGIFR